MSEYKQQSSGPLAGVRVVDLTAVVMGPYCTQILADMGADVIKVEPPEGDATRAISVAPKPGMSGIYVNVNRGKRNRVLDLRQPDQLAEVQELIRDADVFIHSLRGKAIAKLGLDYASVRELKPDIVYTNCYGYSRRGPYRDKPAYDDPMQAETGVAYVQQLLTGEPGFVGTIMADKVAGLTAVYATMMALFHRERTGEGQEVEVGMFEAMASFMLVEHANGKLFDPPLSQANYPRAVAPNRKPYKTKDGYITALVYNDKQWSAFVKHVRPPWVQEDDFSTLAKRAKQIDRVYGLLAETFLERTTQEWLDLLSALDVPCAPIRTLDELYSDPHLEACGFFQDVDSSYGRLRYPGVPAWFSATPGGISGPAPELDQSEGKLTWRSRPSRNKD
jgi:crotonobetainyl-CoA:carnitine CoA-transferase CaiB-like acyl-CoA transferase